jgi:hypothetical protein
MKASFLTARWNNILSIVLGVIVALCFIVVLTGVIASFTSADAASFIALVALGGVT